MLTYSFDEVGNDSLYQYLYKCIKNDIINKTLLPDEKLPSKRPFAKHLGISVITVENAYEQLISEGYLYSIPKKGFFVADVNTLLPSKPSKAEFKSNNFDISNDFLIDLPDKEKNQKQFIDLTSNKTDISNFPFSVWSKLVREILNENQEELITNPPSGGVLKLRTAIADHLKQFRDISVRPEQIIIGAGTEYLYGLLIQLLGFDKIYAVEDPGYQKIAKIYQKHQVTCCHVPLDKSGISLSDLNKSGADILHLSPSHHFPTGLITPISRRYELLGWAAQSEQRYIIEDDYDSEFRMVGKPVPSMLNIDVSEKIIYMNTFTKTLASTVRISYMVLPLHLVKRYYTELSFYSCTVSNFEQYILAKFIQDGYFEKHINRMRSFYHQKRDLLISKIKKSELNTSVRILEEDSGLHFILEIQTNLTDSEFCEAALNNGIKIAALSNFYVHHVPELEHRFIINYSSLKEEDMDHVIHVLEQGTVLCPYTCF